jgi:hypothetical protein
VKRLDPLSPLAGSKDLPNMLDLIMNAMQTLQRELGQFKAISADVRITPDLAALTWIEFYNPQPSSTAASRRPNARSPRSNVCSPSAGWPGWRRPGVPPPRESARDVPDGGGRSGRRRAPDQASAVHGGGVTDRPKSKA